MGCCESAGACRRKPSESLKRQVGGRRLSWKLSLTHFVKSHQCRCKIQHVARVLSNTSSLSLFLPTFRSTSLLLAWPGQWRQKAGRRWREHRSQKERDLTQRLRQCHELGLDAADQSSSVLFGQKQSLLVGQGLSPLWTRLESIPSLTYSPPSSTFHLSVLPSESSSLRV